MTQLTATTPLKELLKITPACSCDACCHGCTLGSGFFAEGEKEKLAKHLKCSMKELEENHLESLTLLGKKMWRPKLNKLPGRPYGPCSFFDKETKKCGIHPVKPLECKLAMGCKPFGSEISLWFMLNHILDIHDATSVKEYISYLQSGGKTLPGGSLRELIPDEEERKRLFSENERL